jgi:hypothetical protein
VGGWYGWIVDCGLGVLLYHEQTVPMSVMKVLSSQINILCRVSNRYVVTGPVHIRSPEIMHVTNCTCPVESFDLMCFNSLSSTTAYFGMWYALGDVGFMYISLT